MALIYQDLIELALNQEGATSQFTNRKSTLLGYLEHLGLDENSNIGPELADTNGINRWLEAESFADATKRSYRTHMRAWQAFHQRLLSAQALPDDPRERTKAVTLLAIEKVGSQTELARLIGISPMSISVYASGKAAVGTRVFAVRLEVSRATDSWTFRATSCFTLSATYFMGTSCWVRSGSPACLRCLRR